jgi:pimeloyl-ACP methyl ester carboxylesterase
MSQAEFAELEWAGRPLRIEYEWVGERVGERPLFVFLHEGLGSASMWKDFPTLLCDAARARGLVYSRPGYGRSTPRPPAERWALDFMQRQAYEVLPELLLALRIEQPVWLFGHSDGGSIALLFAARFPRRVAGLVVLAPHIFVEEFGLASIREARETYLGGDLRRRLARYHEDVDSAFWGWNDVWLDPAFAAFNIEAELASITCPVLAMQGLDDQYGTLEQIRGIARRVPTAELLTLPHCGHSPHRDQTAKVVEATLGFVTRPRGQPSESSRLLKNGLLGNSRSELLGGEAGEAGEGERGSHD